MGSQIGTGRGGGRRGRSWVSRRQNGTSDWAFLPSPSLPSNPPRPAEDGLLRRTQLTLLLDWAELSEVKSRQSDEAVAFSVRLGDHNFDNCALR